MPIKGIHVVHRTLASGETRTYRYAFRGGDRILLAETDPAHDQAVLLARGKKQQRNFATLINLYLQSAEFNSLASSSQKSYASYIAIIKRKWGRLTIKTIEKPSQRAAVKQWRDSYLSTPRKADYLWSVMRRVLAYAKDCGLIKTNICDRGGRVYNHDRSDNIWTDRDLCLLKESASKEVFAVVSLALWTGQRLGDCIRLPWAAYDGRVLIIRQAKSARGKKRGRPLTIPVCPTLQIVLQRLLEENNRRPLRSDTILVNSLGKTWTPDGFRCSFQKAREKAGLSRLSFHDLRGTAITRMSLANCTIQQISTFSGHSLSYAHTIVAHYLHRSEILAESAASAVENMYGGSFPL